MSRPPIEIVGIGEDGLAGLGDRARALVRDAELLVGGARHLALVPDHRGDRLAWRSPLVDTLAELERQRHRRIVVLATGDPLWFGIGRLLLQHFGPQEVRVHPHPSAFQLACARLGWPLDRAVTVSLHGRPLASLRRWLQPGRRILALTDGGEAPVRIARMLVEDGFAGARLHVLQHMGGPDETVARGTAADLADSEPFAALNLVAIELPEDAVAVGASPLPGLPDRLYAHDGNITKAEVRAVTVAALAPRPGLLLWDVGAGSGAVAIEWMRAAAGARAIAIEQRPERAARIRINAERLGVPELELVTARAPAALEGLPPPDVVFVGGGLAGGDLLERCCERLRPGGRLVANAVSVEGEAALHAFVSRHGGMLRRLAVQRAEPAGGAHVWRALAPVTQLVHDRAS